MAYIALYRRWRPETFDDVIGQEHITTTLKNQLKNNRAAHAYLFCGPRGTGKTSTAKIFARALNCTQPQDGNPCNQCHVCRRIISEVVTDVIEIDAASNNGVDEIRELRENVKFTPTAGKCKVYIIDEVHMLSAGAFNALLKTLEEPPEHVVFILATTEPEKLPATILSRCQRYDFRRISSKCIADRLRYIADTDDISIEEDAAEYIARMAEGGMRDALSIMEQCLSYGNGTITYQQIVSVLGTTDIDFKLKMADAVIKKDTVKILKMLNDITTYGRDLNVFIKDLIMHFRNLLIIKSTNKYEELLDIPQEQINEYRDQAKDVETNSIMRIIKILSRCQNEMKRAVQPAITLEMAMIEICHPEVQPDIDGLIERISVLEDKLNNIKPGQAMQNVPQPPPSEQPKAVKEEKQDKKQKTKKIEKKSDKKQKSEKIEEKSDKKPQNMVSEPAPELKLIKEKWKDIMANIKNEKMFVYTFLLKAHPALVKGDVLVISINQDVELYKTALDKSENKEFVKGVIKETTGYDMNIKYVLREEQDNQQTFENKEDIMQQPIVKEAVQLFGKDKVEIIDD
ncbi:MAG: DNA polymerase III subunit gamma/tau [Clostridia bacterium]|nr:DNA polymerase III subunit gamma/tau [Clostridia bacterium]